MTTARAQMCPGGRAERNLQLTPLSLFRGLHPAEALADGSLQSRVRCCQAEIAALPPELDGQDWHAAKAALKRVFDVSLMDILAVEFGTEARVEFGEQDTLSEAFRGLDTEVGLPCPDWFTPALLSDAERKAAVTPDFPISLLCGETTVCPVHRREYQIVTGDPCRDCDACFEEKAKQELHAQASAQARQNAERELESLPPSAVEEPALSFLEQVEEDRKMGRLFARGPC